LVELFTDDAHVGLARIVGREIDPETTVEKFEDREWVADFVGDLGGEEAQGREAFVFAEGIFALENAGVEAGILQGDSAERGEGSEETFLVVIKAVDAIGEDGEHAEYFAFVTERRGEGGNERGVEGQVVEVAKVGRLDVGEGDGAAGVDGRSEGARIERERARGWRGNGGAGGQGREA
jgi:hypothetical protein